MNRRIMLTKETDLPEFTKAGIIKAFNEHGNNILIGRAEGESGGKRIESELYAMKKGENEAELSCSIITSGKILFSEETHIYDNIKETVTASITLEDLQNLNVEDTIWECVEKLVLKSPLLYDTNSITMDKNDASKLTSSFIGSFLKG